MRIKTDIPLFLNDISKSLFLNKIFSENQPINAITTNSKLAKRQDLFIALQGISSSGEEYIDEAKNQGAYVISAQNSSADFYVADTSDALLNIASYYKSKLPFLKKTIAVTGSVGKTTVKNILYSILSKKYATHATKENFNNKIGLSHTILTSPLNTEYLICELGMNHIGEISVLSKALKPDIAIITNVGNSHIGNLGSRRLIAKAKLEVMDGMTSENIIIPMHEPLLQDIKGVRFSLFDNSADYYLEPLLETSDGTIFNLKTPAKQLFEQNTSLPGRNALLAILIAAAVLEELNIDLNVLSERLPFLEYECTRGNYLNIKDIILYDDTYSSSPEAVISDFEYLNLKKGKSKSCMLGDMLELGSETERLHREIGAAAYRYGFRKLYLFGVYSPFFAIGAKDAGMDKNDIYINTDITSPEITGKQILSNYLPNEIILFKASHALRAQRIIDYIKDELTLEK